MKNKLNFVALLIALLNVSGVALGMEKFGEAMPQYSLALLQSPDIFCPTIQASPTIEAKMTNFTDAGVTSTPKVAVEFMQGNNRVYVLMDEKFAKELQHEWISKKRSDGGMLEVFCCLKSPAENNSDRTLKLFVTSGDYANKILPMATVMTEQGHLDNVSVASEVRAGYRFYNTEIMAADKCGDSCIIADVKQDPIFKYWGISYKTPNESFRFYFLKESGTQDIKRKFEQYEENCYCKLTLPNNTEVIFKINQIIEPDKPVAIEPGKPVELNESVIELKGNKSFFGSRSVNFVGGLSVFAILVAVYAHCQGINIMELLKNNTPINLGSWS